MLSSRLEYCPPHNSQRYAGTGTAAHGWPMLGQGHPWGTATMGYSILPRNARFLRYLTLQLSSFSSLGLQVSFQKSQSFLISNKPIYIYTYINFLRKKKNHTMWLLLCLGFMIRIHYQDKNYIALEKHFFPSFTAGPLISSSQVSGFFCFVLLYFVFPSPFNLRHEWWILMWQSLVLLKNLEDWHTNLSKLFMICRSGNLFKIFNYFVRRELCFAVTG